MQIIDEKYNWNGGFTSRFKTVTLFYITQRRLNAPHKMYIVGIEQTVGQASVIISLCVRTAQFIVADR